MMLKRVHLTLMFSLLTLLVNAQELWMEPSKFACISGDTLRVQFKEGTDFIGSIWKPDHIERAAADKSALERAELRQQDKVIDVHDHFVNDALGLALQVEGTYLLGVRTTVRFREVDAQKFNAYLKEAALDEAHYQRQKTNTLDKKGKEYFTHFAKLIVQTEKKTDDTYKKETGASIEIILQQNPYTLKVGDRVQFKILADGKPLFGARVKVWNRNNHRTSVQNIFTEQNGMIETHISNPGAWMVSVVRMIPSKDPKADWQSFHGTLVFGVR